MIRASYSVKGAGEPANLTVRWISPVPAGLEGLAQSFIATTARLSWTC
jgi:hypothetical protein